MCWWRRSKWPPPSPLELTEPFGVALGLRIRLSPVRPSDRASADLSVDPTLTLTPGRELNLPPSELPAQCDVIVVGAGPAGSRCEQRPSSGNRRA